MKQPTQGERAGDHDHAGHAGHGHGGPIVWDPQAAQRSKAKWLIASGLALIVCGAALWNWNRPRPFVPPAPADLALYDEPSRAEFERLIGAVRARADDAMALGRLALFFDGRRAWGEAQVCYARADELDPSRSVWAFGAANAARQRGAREEAAELARALLLRFPGDPSATALLAELGRARE